NWPETGRHGHRSRGSSLPATSPTPSTGKPSLRPARGAVPPLTLSAGSRPDPAVSPLLSSSGAAMVGPAARHKRTLSGLEPGDTGVTQSKQDLTDQMLVPREGSKLSRISAVPVIPCVVPFERTAVTFVGPWPTPQDAEFQLEM